MEFAIRRPASVLLATLALACTCCGAPGSAAAGETDTADGESILAISANLAGGASAGDEAVAGEEAAAEGSGAGVETVDAAVGTETAAEADGTATYSFGGVQFTVPEGFDVVDLGSMAMASNADGSVLVSVASADDGAAVPASADAWGAYFATAPQAAAGESDGTLLDEGLCTLADGTQAYVYRISYNTDDNSPALIVQCYVPVDGGAFTLVQVTCNSSNEAGETADAVLESIVLATDAAIQLGSADDTDAQPASDGEGAAVIMAGETVEAGGVAFVMPVNCVDDDTVSADESTWYSEDRTLMLGIMPSLIDGYSAVGDDLLDLIAEGIAQDLGGSIESTSVSEHDGTTVNIYVFTFASEGREFVGALGMAVLSDDTVTGVIALTSLAAAADNAAAVASVFESIRITG